MRSITSLSAVTQRIVGNHRPTVRDQGCSREPASLEATAATHPGHAKRGPPVRVLITGATGFVGGRIARRYVQRGDEVTALVRTASAALDEIGILQLDGGFEAVNADLCAGMDLIVHAAAGTGPDVDLARTVNQAGTARMVDASLAAGVPRFVHISTTSVYDRTDRGDAELGEDSPLVVAGDGPDEVSPYALTKAEAEHEVTRAVEAGLSAVILRPPAILGAAPTSTWGTRVPRRVQRGEPLPIHPDTTFGWVHIDDLVDVVVAAGSSGDVFVANVVGGHVPFRTYLDAVATILPDQPPMPVAPDAAPWRGRYATRRAPTILGTPLQRRFEDAMDEIADSWRAGDPERMGEV
jgi:2-alkyl-3-oxoalkanoate reductase